MNRLNRWIATFFIVLLVSTAYVAAFASPTIFYMSNVLFHYFGGIGLFVALVLALRKDEELRSGILTATGFFPLVA